MHLMLNSYWEPLTFELPPRQGEPWRLVVDTALESPYDIVPLEEAPSIVETTYRVQARSSVMLIE